MIIKINHPRGVYPFTLYKNYAQQFLHNPELGRQEIQPALFSGIFA